MNTNNFSTSDFVDAYDRAMDQRRMAERASERHYDVDDVDRLMREFGIADADESNGNERLY